MLHQFSELLVERALSRKVGDPLEPDTRVGPLASQAQYDRVRGYLDIASGEGGRFLAGGDGPPHGAGLPRKLPIHSAPNDVGVPDRSAL